MNRHLQLFSMRYVATLTCCLGGFAAIAETDEDDEQQVEDEVVVHAHYLSATGLAQAVEVMTEEEIAQRRLDTLADTVAQLPGIRSATFGTAVGRPVIQGMDGPRVKVLQDRTSTMDVGVVLPDHPLMIDAFSANQIEILKGPSALIYGSGGIGGVINAETGRIPLSKPDDDVDGRVSVGLSDNSGKSNVAGRIDLVQGDWVIHADALNRSTDAYDIPGCMKSHEYLEREHEEHEDEHEEGEHEDEHEEEEEATCGTVTDSFSDVRSNSFGISRVVDNVSMGFSRTLNQGDFGIPIEHAHGAHEEDDHDDDHDDDADHDDDHDADHDDDHDDHDDHEGESVTISYEQTRTDFDSEFRFESPVVDRLRVRFALSEYSHDELAGDEVETSFLNDAYELHGDLLLASESLQVIGLHLYGRDYEVKSEGESHGVVSRDSMGLAWMMETVGETGQWELGARLERHATDLNEHGDRDYTNYAIAIGYLHEPDSTWRLGANLDLSTRAPVIEELASEGVHLATGSVELGNIDLDNEALFGLGVNLGYSTPRFDSRVSAYHRRFSDFIYIANTGEIDHDLPVFSYRQNDVTFTGIDVAATLILHEQGTDGSDLRFAFDTVKAEPGNGERLPRIAPSRTVLGYDVHRGPLQLSLDYTLHGEAKKIAAYELPTEAWNDLAMRLEWTIDGANNTTTIYLHGRNLMDEEQRNHVSVIKDRVPLPGRMLEAGFRFEM